MVWADDVNVWILNVCMYVCMYVCSCSSCLASKKPYDAPYRYVCRWEEGCKNRMMTKNVCMCVCMMTNRPKWTNPSLHGKLRKQQQLRWVGRYVGRYLVCLKKLLWTHSIPSFTKLPTYIHTYIDTEWRRSDDSFQE